MSLPLRGTVVSHIHEGAVLAEIVRLCDEQGIHLTAVSAAIELIANGHYELWVTRDFWPNAPKAVYERVYVSKEGSL